MKNNLLLIIIMLSIFTNAQEKKKKRSESSFNPFRVVKITLRDGAKIEGLGKIKLNDEIIYKVNENAEITTYNHKEVKELTITFDEIVNIYEYKIVEGGGVAGIKLINPILFGKINLYLDASSGTSYGSNISGGYGFSSYSKTKYYISRSGEDTVTNLKIGNTYSKRFKTIAQKFFADCPDLLNKIETKHFNRYGIKSVVKYYNEKCK